jgi:hypothetical protein
MTDDKAPVFYLHLHPEFQDQHRGHDLKNALLSATLAYAQIALDTAAFPGASGQAAMILERACIL